MTLPRRARVWSLSRKRDECTMNVLSERNLGRFREVEDWKFVLVRMKLKPWWLDREQGGRGRQVS